MESLLGFLPLLILALIVVIVTGNLTNMARATGRGAKHLAHFATHPAEVGDVIGAFVAQLIYIALGLAALAVVIYGAVAAGPVVVLLFIIVLLLLPRN
jgi:hypothetical protein